MMCTQAISGLESTEYLHFLQPPMAWGMPSWGQGCPQATPNTHRALGWPRPINFNFLAKKWQFGHGKKWQIDCLCQTLWAIGILWPPPKWPQVCPWPPRWPGPHTLQPPWPPPNLAALFPNMEGATHALKKCISCHNVALCGPMGPPTPHPNGPKCRAGH